MSLGRRRAERQTELFIAADRLATSQGHPFCRRLNGLLAEAGFDDFVEQLCQPYYKEDGPGRPSIPPGVYFRMTFIGYFEGIDSYRGIAWRANDSLSLREFLGIPLGESTPEHSTLGKTRNRLPQSVHEQVFQFVLKLAMAKGLLSAKTVAVDSTLLEANAAMKSIVRKDTQENWREYVVRLMREQGLVEPESEPTDEEIRRFDSKRKKKVSNEEWESRTDPDSRIAQMKDGRTHLAYKAEHVIDLESQMLVAAEIRYATDGDAETLVDSVQMAQSHLDSAAAMQHEANSEESSDNTATSSVRIKEVVADKGYHKAETLELAEAMKLRTYIPERRMPHGRRWTDKPASHQRAVRNNRRRVARAKSKRFQRWRSEKVERSFAHVCDTGGSRRSWLARLEKIGKRYLIQAVAYNLGILLRALFGVGKPRRLQDGGNGALCLLLRLLSGVLNAMQTLRALSQALFENESPVLPPNPRWLLTGPKAA